MCVTLVQWILTKSQLMPTPPKFERIRLLSNREEVNQTVSTLASQWNTVRDVPSVISGWRAQDNNT